MFPMLEDISNFWRAPTLTNTIIIGAQHILGCTTEMFKNLCKLGLPPENVFLIGKCYSTSLEAMHELQELGIYVSPLSTTFDSHRNYDDLYFENVKKFLNLILPKFSGEKNKQIVILDDGGTVINLASELSDQYDLKVTGAVEQTSSGFNFLKDKVSNLPFPILNVARSNAKLIYESPFIAKNCLKELFLSANFDDFQDHNILILGNGSIGKAIYRELSHFCCEMINPEELDETDFRKKISQANVIVGCTGFTSLPSKFFPNIQPNTYLISCSSSDREFDAVHLRQNLPKYGNCFCNVKVNGINLIRSGFPVNFSGKKFVSHPQDIELTISLLYSSILNILSVSNIPCGFASLDSKSEKFIISKYRQRKILAPSDFLLNIAKANRRLYSELTG